MNCILGTLSWTLVFRRKRIRLRPAVSSCHRTGLTWCARAGSKCTFCLKCTFKSECPKAETSTRKCNSSVIWFWSLGLNFVLASLVSWRRNLYSLALCKPHVFGFSWGKHVEPWAWACIDSMFLDYNIEHNDNTRFKRKVHTAQYSDSGQQWKRREQTQGNL